jgi:hypothetical protein
MLGRLVVRLLRGYEPDSKKQKQNHLMRVGGEGSWVLVDPYLALFQNGH